MPVHSLPRLENMSSSLSYQPLDFAPPDKSLSPTGLLVAGDNILQRLNIAKVFRLLRNNRIRVMQRIK